MCQTGGPRCDSRVRERLATAEAGLATARERLDHAWQVHEEESDRWRDEYDGEDEEDYEEYRDSDDEDLISAQFAVRAAETEMSRTYGELCATRSGEAEVRALAAEGRLLAGALEQHVTAGAAHRRRGSITRAVRGRDENDDLTGVVGKTGDAVTDLMVVEAAREYAANWADHEPLTDIPAVKQYASEEDKARGVQRWRNKVVNRADRAWQAKRRVEQAERDLTAAQERASSDSAHQGRVTVCQSYLDRARSDRRSAVTNLVLHADKLRIAQQRVVPAQS